MRDIGPGPAAALDELERLVRALGEELSFFRRRALEAERRLREAPAPSASAQPAARDAAGGGEGDTALAERVRTLEAENDDLRARLAEAAERTRAMADRLRFLRQQEEVGGER